MVGSMEITLENVTPIENHVMIEGKTFGTLLIKVNDRLATGGINIINGSSRYIFGPFVSGYPLAEWFMWNWWRLHYDKTSDLASDNFDWNYAHNIKMVGAGYTWPNIAIIPKENYIRIISKVDSMPYYNNLFRYTSEIDEKVSLHVFSSAIDRFVSQIISIIEESGINDSNLHILTADLNKERNNSLLSRFRRTEAALGLDPDEMDPKEVSRRFVENSKTQLKNKTL